jgi:hypothetical protein
MITVPDHNAGQMMKCPLCAGTFTAPSLPESLGGRASEPAPSATSLNPAVSASNPGTEGSSSQTTPRWESASSSGLGTEPSSLAPGSLSGDYRRQYTVWISPRVVPWIAPVGLALIFLLFFFYWRSLPTVVEEVKKDYSISETIPPSQIGWAKMFSNGWLILYFLCYLLTLVLVVGLLLLNFKVIALPPQLKRAMPWRSAIIGGLALLGFLLLLLGSLGEDFPTFWFGLTAWIQFAVLVGLVLEYWLEYRGPGQPLPKIDILW